MIGVSAHLAPASGTAPAIAMTAATRSAPVLRTRRTGLGRTTTSFHPAVRRCAGPGSRAWTCGTARCRRNLFEGRSLIRGIPSPPRGFDVALLPPAVARPADRAMSLGVPTVAVIILLTG